MYSVHSNSIACDIPSTTSHNKKEIPISDILQYLHIIHWSSCLDKMLQIITLCAPRGSNLVKFVWYQFMIL